MFSYNGNFKNAVFNYVKEIPNSEKLLIERASAQWQQCVPCPFTASHLSILTEELPSFLP